MQNISLKVRVLFPPSDPFSISMTFLKSMTIPLPNLKHSPRIQVSYPPPITLMAPKSYAEAAAGKSNLSNISTPIPHPFYSSSPLKTLSPSSPHPLSYNSGPTNSQTKPPKYPPRILMHTNSLI